MKKKFVRITTRQADLIEERKAAVMSGGETFIHDILVKRGIRFEREFYFHDCINEKTGSLLFFDFYIPEFNVAIEYDGIQHYRAVEGREKLDSVKARDKIKNLYCNKNGIYILRIRNYTLKNVEAMLDEAICRKSFKKNKNKGKKKVVFYTQNKKPPSKIMKNGRVLDKEKIVSRLKSKIELQNQEIENRRNEARLRYPTEYKLYISEKNDRQI